MSATTRQVKLIRRGRDQVVCIPRDWELPGNEVILRKEGGRLVMEPLRKGSLLALLEEWEPLDVEFPDADEDLEPIEEPGRL